MPELRENAALEKAIRWFTEDARIMEGMAVVCGEGEHTLAGFAGGTGTGRAVDAHTLCDLASATKLFTGMAALRLQEDGVLDLRRPARELCPAFTALADVTADQLAGFEVNPVTPERVDAQADADSAEACLHEAAAVPFAGTRFYSDIPALILGEIIEHVTGETLYDTVKRLILDPCGMIETYAKIPEDRLADCVLYDREHRIERSRYILREGLTAGLPHDPKARILCRGGAHLCGHAGLFSTPADMARFCRGVLAGRVLRPETLARMARNRMGRALPGGGWSQFLGTMCYVRHPDQFFSEVPVYESGRAIAMGGFTGNHVSFDPETGRWAVFLGNRVLNRLTVLLPAPGRTKESYGLAPDGTGSVVWPDGRIVFSSVDYVHQKDERLHAVIMRETGWDEQPFTAE